MMNRSTKGGGDEVRGPYDDALPGIVIHGREDGEPVAPRIQAFIWGGKLPPNPLLPYGRWKGVA